LILNAGRRFCQSEHEFSSRVFRRPGLIAASAD
jgi:hypothetical protein